MKNFLYLLLLWIGTTVSLQAQINFQGCTPEFGTTTYTFFSTGTTNDAGTIRNTFETTPINGAQACNGLGFGFCEFRIIWEAASSSWVFEITDGASFFPIYRNTSASFPNPPDLTLGTWVEEITITGGACGGNNSISTLSGDVQNTVGSSSAPEINLTGNGNTILDGDVTPRTADGTDFGNVAVSTSAPQVFVIDNSAGTGTLTITSIVVSGAQAGDFVVSGAPVSVAAGASANFTLTFSPSAAGTRNATITINNDDADEGVYDFAVRGNGTVSPEINITGNGNTILDGDVTPRTADGTNFGNVAVSTSAPQVFVIDNSAGTGTLTITSIVVSGAQAGDFVVSGAPVSVAAGASANFTLTFSPSVAGFRNAIVTINNNDANEGVYDFAVRGNGTVSPEINVTGNGNSIVDGDITPSATDGTAFGNLAIGNSAPQVFVIDNSAGTGTLTITSIVVSGAQAGDFVVSGAPVSIAAGASANFTLTFTPSAAGTRTATVTINNNDANEGVYDFAVRGNGTAVPEINLTGNGSTIVDGDVTPTTVDGTDFGNVAIGNSVPQNFIIDNTAGTAPLTVNSIVLSGAQAADFVVTGLTFPRVIAAGASASFTLTFNPSAAGARNATVTVNNDDADEGVYDFAVTGNGTVIASIAITEWLSDPSIDDATDEWVELYNYGTLPVDIQNWRLRDEDVDNALITANSYVIQPGDYVILARNKASFEADWLTCPDSRVLQVAMILGNTADEIIIEDNTGTVVWSVAYGADHSTGQATFYTENTYVPRIWGSKAAPGVDRSGPDPATGTFGYQKNNATPDPNARAALNGDIGSPFDGNPSLADINRGDVLEFTAPNNVIQAANPADFFIGTTTSLTLEAWIYPTDVANRTIMSLSSPGLGASGYTLFIDGNSNLAYEHLSGPRRDVFAGNTTLVANRWYHVVSVLDRPTNTISLYINGILDGTFVNANLAFSADFATNNFTVSLPNATGFEGFIDEVRVWHTPRTATQVRENMHLTLSACEANLVAYYQFNNGTGSTTVTDATGSNNATLINMNPSTDWVASEVNVGNDNSSASNSQTLAVAAGTSAVNFNTANASLNFTAHSAAEDFTVTYEAFRPNAITGITGTSITQNPMWTINKSTATATQNYEVTFTLPTATFNTAGKDCNFQLYNRAMYEEGSWTVVANEAVSFTANTVTFAGITTTGQFLIVEDPADAPDLTRGRALEFDGNNSQIIIGNVQELNLDFNEAYTLEAWIRVPVGTTTNGQILSKFDGNSFVGYTFGYLGASGEVNFGITNFNTFEFFEIRTAAGFDIRDGEWHHVAVSYSGSGNATGADLYIDGVRSTRVALAGSVTTSIATTAPAIIGNYSAGTEFFTGDMDKLAVWDRNLTANEIRESMHLTFDGCESNLIAYYQMNESPGSVILPDLASGNNGTLSGFNVITSWINSTVNLGNDAGGTSGSETILVPAGANNQTFGTVNASIQFNAHSVPENYTVTYEAFAPNAITGITGTNIIQNPMWTVNKETGTSTQDMDLTFIFPAATFSTTNPCGLQLYNRPMNSDGAWTMIASASTFTTSSATFNNITTTGQFLVIEDNTVGGDIVRGDVLDFDGIDDEVTIGDMGTHTGDWTSELWFNVDNVSDFRNLLHTDVSNTRGADYGFRVETSATFGQGSLYISISGNGGFDPHTVLPLNALQANQWYHLAVVGDRTNNRVQVYLNGIEVVNAAHTNWPDEFDNVTLGRSFLFANPLGSRFFDGQMDEVKFWKAALTATEIRESMHLTLDGCEADLWSYWQFNDGTGATTLADKSSNGHNGTLVNMDPATDWVASGVNVGNDAANTSTSQTLAIPTGTGTRQANFTAANLFMEFVGNAIAEDYTVTYEAFTPNSTIGAVGTTIIQNPVWTVNKETAGSAPRMNMLFTYPTSSFTILDGTKYRLYWRPMYSDEDWILLKNYARTVTANSIEFTDLYETGQFMVVQASDLLISDVRGKMYDFGTNSEYIDATSTAVGLPQGNDPFTVEAWVKTTQSSIGNFVSWGRRTTNNRAGFAVRNSRLAFIGESNDYTGNTVIADGEWHHVTVAYDGTIMRFYVDGILDINPTTSPLNITNQNLILGSISLPSAAEFYNGSLDEVRIWNTARTQNEIRENMHLTLKGTETGLIVYYQFNDDAAVGTNGGVKDAFGVANGTTVNMTSNNQIPSEVAVAGGVSERMTVTTTGLMNFTTPKVAIDFNSNPNGEIVVSRLMTEKPHGWETITGDVDNEYFVVWNYGTNQAPVINEMTFNELSYFTPSMVANDVGLYKRGSRQFGPTWGTAIAPANTITTGAPSSANFAGAPLTTGFSQLVIAQTNQNGSLPIELISFEAERANRQEVQLHWTTAQEINNKGFEVERLLEGEIEFIKVAYVEGQGTNAGVTTYYQVDPNSFTGVSYYRLKQIDTDGSFQYSPTRAVEGQALPNGTGITVFPNPTQGALNLQILEPLEPQQVYITLTDAQGRVVKEQWNTVSSEQVIPLPHLLTNLPNNLYFLQVQTADGKKQWSKKISLQ